MTDHPNTHSSLLNPTKASESWGSFLKSAKFRQTLVTSLWGFLTSTERAIILPTLWLYLKINWSLTAAQQYYAIAMAAFSLTIIFATPFCGYLADHGVSTKVIVVASNQLEFIGNIVYLFAPHPSVVLLGRLIAGIGGGCEPPLYADLSRVTSLDERTPYIVCTMMARQFGLIFGPVFTIFMTNMVINSGKFVISVYNGPGLIMSICWALHSLITLCIYPDINIYGEEVKDGHVDKRKRLTLCTCVKDESTEDLSKFSETDCSNSISQYYKRFNVVSLLLLSFTSYFNLMCLEALLTPYFNDQFKYNELDISYIYLGASLLVILVFIVLHHASKKCTDWQIAVCGCALLVGAYLSLTFITALLSKIPPKLDFSLLLCAGMFHVFGLPLVFTCSDSMYSKLMPSEEMDRAQMIFRTVNNVSCLCGMLVGGALWFLTPWMMALMGSLVFIPMLMLAFQSKEFIMPND